MHDREHIYAVIMAGGGGTRLWPLSRKPNPKQVLKLFKGRSLFEIAMQRICELFDMQHVLIVTVDEQVQMLKELTPELTNQNFIIEPMPRGTASVVALAAATLQKIDPHAVMVILTADHFIENVADFAETLDAACAVAQADVLVTLGIQPTFPATGYGYIERGEQLSAFDHIKAYKVNAFVEKPSAARAAEYLKNGRYSWNSGMFIWKVDVILAEIKLYLPLVFDTVQSLSAMHDKDHHDPKYAKLWEALKTQTIDYGIMEKSDRVVVLPASSLGWNDVGSWDSLFEVLTPDLSGNIVINARHVGMETDDTLVYSTLQERLVATIGVKKMIIVDTPDALLICPRDDSQKIKELVQYLKENQYTQFL